jgi:16S rRNA (cytidine1402-2'-O)-methyltransferase
MTKIHEEFIAGTLASIRSALSGRRVKGEIALLVAGAGGDVPAGDVSSGGAVVVPEEPVAARVRRLIGAGVDRKEAMRRVARAAGLSRRDVYRQMLDEREDGE